MTYICKRTFYAQNLHKKFLINDSIEDNVYHQLNPLEKQNFKFSVVSSSVEQNEYKDEPDGD